eukprot:5779221-Prymnesium_polylepis.1
MRGSELVASCDVGHVDAGLAPPCAAAGARRPHGHTDTHTALGGRRHGRAGDPGWRVVTGIPAPACAVKLPQLNWNGTRKVWILRLGGLFQLYYISQRPFSLGLAYVA